jgi:hypothetical protein
MKHYKVGKEIKMKMHIYWINEKCGTIFNKLDMYVIFILVFCILLIMNINIFLLVIRRFFFHKH